MFSKSDGPTALRADLVRLLSFSAGRVERQSGGATVESLAALAGVWNGRKGHVAVLIRDIEPALVERYVSSLPITTEAELEAVVQEGIAFAESLGFSMDAPDFEILSAEARSERIHRWNKLRKVRKISSATDPREDSSPSIPEIEAPDPVPVPTGYEIELEDLEVPPPSPPLELDAGVPVRSLESESSAALQGAPSAVLGRVSLVRKENADARRLELLARLLASY